ncbi:hypothetical protein [Rhodopseudomonas palustris]|uniref:hypothetical protein n=1 Tax=Rhodopseudomonas palustris TaxID=1076 RepID=UPI0021F3A3AB|nr:hypothetical protein [Rhodopseudomonas palustris]UYO55914.1 hypothetical protein KQX61_11140 [Rhodopseudomonas palustris]
MTKRAPIPPDNRSPKGPGADPVSAPHDDRGVREVDAERGQRDNIEQNTHNQGCRQDR